MTILRNFTALFFFIAAINLANAKPNVLLIVCDDLNTHVSTSGYPQIKTPPALSPCLKRSASKVYEIYYFSYSYHFSARNHHT